MKEKTIADPTLLAIDGGEPVRGESLPYGRQTIEPEDIQAVVEVMRSDWLTTGPMVGAFEQEFAETVGSGHAVAVSSGTAALHATMHALGIGPGDEVIVPTITFAATANCVIYQGGTPVFCDVEPGTLQMGPEQVRARLTPRTRAVINVDFAGQACDYDALQQVSDDRDLVLVADACHALGGTYKERKVGSIEDLSAFSFHPVKHITSGEGGMVTTDDAELARRMRMFRAHGVTVDFRERVEKASWLYEVVDLGYNYRLTDIQCALGRSQLRRLYKWVERRQEIARVYDDSFARQPALRPLERRAEVSHSYHLYVVRLELERLTAGRADVYTALQAEGIGVNVHYIPIHLHPYYRQKLGTAPGDCPVAEEAYQAMLSLPLYHGMTDQDARDVVRAVEKVLARYSKRGE